MKSILIIQTASIGDVILATPVAEKLHLFFPEAQIDLLVKRGNEGLFKDHPYLRQVRVWDKGAHSTRNFLRIIRLVRKTKYSLVVNVQRFFKTGMLTAFSGAGMTIGFDKNPMSFLFSRSIPHKLDGIQEVDRNLSLVEAITDGTRVLPALYPSSTDFEKVASLKTGRYYTLSPASLWFTKQYPMQKWVELVKNIAGDADIYLLGSGNDQDLCDKIIGMAGHPKVKNLAGKLTFLESAALMVDARMNFTNDSAPMHLASAVNAPVTAIYCSTIPGFGFGPTSGNSCVVETEVKLSCRPCGLHGYRECPEKHFRCAWDINVQQLTERL